MCALHSVAKMEHHASAISLSFFGNMAFNGPSSDSHAASVVEQSSLNIVLFLLFQMCQQHNIMKVPKCLLGICSGDMISYSFWTGQAAYVSIWTTAQNSCAAMHPKMTWASVSSAAWHMSHTVGMDWIRWTMDDHDDGYYGLWGWSKGGVKKLY
jgi:hypothetical protein